MCYQQKCKVVSLNLAHPVYSEQIYGKSTQVSNIMLKSTFSGLQRCRWQYVRLAVAASHICEIQRNSPQIRPYSSSRSSKVTDLGANQKAHMQLPISH